MGEHFRQVKLDKVEDLNTSAIAYHVIKQHGSQPDPQHWRTEVLHVSNGTQDRKALEALEILRRKPSLNRDGGVQIIITGCKI